MNRILKPLALGVVTAIGLGAPGAAYGNSPANNNVCWGKAASHLATSGIMGKHSSAHGAFTPDPGTGGRRGVGNVSKEDHGDPTAPGGGMSQGAQGQHAVNVGINLGRDDLPFLAGTPEGSIEPFECNSPGNSNKVTIEPVG